MKPLDLSGQHFGQLVVLYRVENYVKPSGKQESKWLCQCSCGKTIEVTASRLKSGNTQSCGCSRKKPHSDLTGKKFGKLTVIKQNGYKGNKMAWLCKCDCGNFTTVSTDSLNSGQTQSCGCLRKERLLAALTTHGMAHTKIYKIWEAMKRRCDCPKVERYSQYGGRGITYTLKWKKFEPFYQWALSAGYKEGLSIDRINVNGNYEPSNCRWIPLRDQAYNKTTSKLLTCRGITLTIAEWSQRTGIPYEAIYQRIVRLKWDTERALTEPAKVGRNQFSQVAS